MAIRRRRRRYADRYQRINDPWIEGFTAARQLVQPSGNPYASGSDSGQLWSDGWREARVESEEHQHQAPHQTRGAMVRTAIFA